MQELVLRSDVVTLKATTVQLQSDLSIDIHEAADIVLGVLREHGSSIQFWIIPARGLPYKDDEPAQKRRCSNEWLESKWWDKEHQERQNELLEMSGAKTFRDEIKIEDMAILRKDAYRLFFSDALVIVADRCTAEPKDKLVSITKLLSSIANLSDGRAEASELAKAFSDIYDADRTMIYQSGNWLCEPINGGVAGHNKRADISCEFVNSYGKPELNEYLILKDDALTIARQLWMKYFDDPFIDLFEELRLGYPTNQSELKTSTESGTATGIGSKDSHGYLDPSNPRYAPKLAAAVKAWQAVTDPKGKSPKQALDKWLREHAADFGLLGNDGIPVNLAIKECSRVANWRPGGGAARTPG